MYIANSLTEMKELAQALAEPFPAEAISFRAGATTKDKKSALALAYIDARNVMERLDEVVGMEGWEDNYRLTETNAVICSLTIRVFLKESIFSITKEGIGMPSDIESDKGAESDALKRAAVKFGIARYLYGLPQSWVPYNETTKRLEKTPNLPSWALPKGSPKPKTEPKPEPDISRPFTKEMLIAYLKEWEGRTRGKATPNQNKLLTTSLYHLYDKDQEKVDACFDILWGEETRMTGLSDAQVLVMLDRWLKPERIDGKWKVSDFAKDEAFTLIA
jgi:hypothetical protein